MTTEIITKSNLNKYSDFLGPEGSDLIGRDYHRALAVTENGPAAAIIWELLYSETDETDTASVIRTLKISDKEAGDILLEKYTEFAAAEGVKQSSFECSREELSGIKDILADHNFETHKGAGLNYTIKAGAIKEALLLIKPHNADPVSYPLTDISRSEFEECINSIIERSKRENIKDISLLGYDMYDPEISSVVVSGGNVEGALLAHKISDSAMKLEFLDAIGNDRQGKYRSLILCSAKAAVKALDPDTDVIIVCRDNSYRGMLKAFFPFNPGSAFRLTRPEPTF